MSKVSLEQRINELESRLAFQDDTVGALNDALARQQQIIRTLQRSMEKLIEEVDDIREQPSEGEEAPPPHY